MSWEYDYKREWTGRRSYDRMTTIPDDRNDWDSEDYDYIHKETMRTNEGVRIVFERNRRNT
jgi:hypothetical protein